MSNISTQVPLSAQCASHRSWSDAFARNCKGHEAELERCFFGGRRSDTCEPGTIRPKQAEVACVLRAVNTQLSEIAELQSVHRSAPKLASSGLEQSRLQPHCQTGELASQRKTKNRAVTISTITKVVWLAIRAPSENLEDWFSKAQDSVVCKRRART